MNPCDHPTAAAKGKSPVGRPGPVDAPGAKPLWYKDPQERKKTETSYCQASNVK